MTPGSNQAVHFMINREVSSYQSALSSWSARVIATRHIMDAFRLATHKPAPGQLIRSLQGMTSSDRMRAESAVERNLTERISDLEVENPSFYQIMRLTQGHWPRIWQSLERKRAMHHQSKTG